MVNPIFSSLLPVPPMIILDDVDAGLSSTDTRVEEDATAASWDSSYARKRLQLVNKLRTIGLDRYIDLPIVAVVGSTSAGKSSLIQAMSGVTLPRDADTCTRCPIECRLMKSDEPWTCRVSLRFATDSDLRRQGGATSVPFGEPIMEAHKDEIEDRVRRAQRAVLTPSVPLEDFVDKNEAYFPAIERSFTENIVCLEISGSDVADLAFVDLPGLVRTVGSSGNAADIGLIENLVVKYIERPNCIILLAVACETHFANQGAHEIVHRYDPKGERTIGVLTKPDKISAGEEERWMKFIRGEEEPLVHGWYCIKRPDFQAMLLDPSLETARNQEKAWFEKTDPWCYSNLKRFFRTPNLVAALIRTLGELVTKRIPELTQRIKELLDSTREQLRSLPKPLSSDSVAEVYDLLRKFSDSILSRITRLDDDDDDDLLSQIEEQRRTFKRKIRATAPGFRAWNKGIQPPEVAVPDDLIDKDNMPLAGECGDPVFLEEVTKRAERTRQRDVPDSFSNEVAKGYLRMATKSWDTPTKKFVKCVFDILSEFVQRTVDEHFKQFTEGGFPPQVLRIVQCHLNACQEATLKHVDLFLRLEQKASTDNAQYFRHFRKLYLSYYTSQRLASQEHPFFKGINMKPFNPNGESKATPAFESGVITAKTSLQKLGITVNDPADLARLLPDDPETPVLAIMATASALFEVSLKRFTDYILLIVEEELTVGLTRDLYTALKDGFSFEDRNIVENCKTLLQEPAETTRLREQLSQALQRLAEAREEISDFWVDFRSRG
ncbi:hypothetical protein FA95DRAFT_1525197 [Auriscalpium vulgare]|uniref:Uncharacterized protein n=1 Tax=Auriscalpium vulgare TaxID=40419 RepID=A0ACB8REK9_9AGAM|nr:hypothetical protein FA95DRAFT_1525197 [Auriscalpium vulgare]